jgi:histidyl-tRNA synthetase
MSDPTSQYKAPRGASDILPPDTELLSLIEGRTRELFDRYGYLRIEPPAFEHTEVFLRGAGEASDFVVNKEMYTFSDRSGRSLTLRPEGTAGVARAVVEHELYKSMPLPLRLGYWGPMFRYEKPQANRARQFIQSGAECYGSAEPTVDAEIMTWGADLYEGLGLDPDLLVNSIGCSDDRERYGAYLRQVLPRLGEMCADCRERLRTNPLRVLDCKNPSCRALFIQIEPIRKFLCDECAAHYERVGTLLDAAGVKWMQADMLVRGIDYYTRTVWEFDMPRLGARGVIGAGGRYDNLVERLGGPSLPAVGMSPGVLATMNALKKVRKPVAWRPDVFVAWLHPSLAPQASKISRDLRGAGLRVISSDSAKSLKAQLRAAARLNACRAVILGPSEAERGVVAVRDLGAGTQQEVPLAELASRLPKC